MVTNYDLVGIQRRFAVGKTMSLSTSIEHLIQTVILWKKRGR